MFFSKMGQYAYVVSLCSKYKGCVIGFDRAFFSEKGLKQVRYVSGNTSIELSDATKLATWIITTKFVDWSWQEEWRDIKVVNELSDFNNKLYYYNRLIVKEIYLGSRIDIKVKNEILQMAKRYHWKVRSIEKSYFEEGKLDADDVYTRQAIQIIIPFY